MIAVLPKKSSRKSRRRSLKNLKRSPKVFVPTPSKWQIVVPFKPISIGLILFFLGTSIYFLLRSDVFVVKSVDELTSGRVNEELKGALEAEIVGRSILTLDVAAVVGRVKPRFLEIKDLSLSKKLPDRIEVQVIYREPLAVVIYSEEAVGEEEGQRVASTHRFLVDEGGLVFAGSPEDAKLPEIDYSNRSVAISDHLSEGNIKTYLDLLILLKESHIPIDWVKMVSDWEVELQVVDGPVVLLSGRKDAASQVAALQLILVEYRIKGVTLGKVDLRFDRPVVEYETAEPQ